MQAENKNDFVRITIQLNKYDFRHKQVLSILRARPRAITEQIVNAVLHYASCPDASTELSRDSLRAIVREVISEMVEDGAIQLQSGAPVAPTTAEPAPEIEDLGDMMSAFR